ncbi:leucine-rich repeat domain-containing protein [Bacteroides sp. 214]|uniref:leucine-rich repeat domain-containing protein n=1 Tax=Bacteroides sp. 214 TaxID=2302935 RepID=UPI0013D7E010|nr:leucine-rich repeat domain-containing protein [Bacteroides sp. 214]NDW13181.1 leucine-rich repeat domain-containing protein [Bacteroides sp. 214]
MDRLDIVSKREGDELTAPEWNKSVDKVNEIIDALNGSETVQRKLYVQNNLETKSLAAQSGQPCVLDFSFISQERYSYSDPYENTGEQGVCTLSVKNSEYTEFTDVQTFKLPSNTAHRLDVAEWLKAGVNQLKLSIRGEITEETTPAYVYNVQLTSLGITAGNFRWWQAYNSAIMLPLHITGNINKKLFVELSGVNNSYKEVYEVNLGAATYTETAYNFSVPHPDIEGVYTLRVWLTNADQSLQTHTISFEVMCAVQAGISKLLCVNNKALQAVNWTENVLFDFAITAGDAAYTGATFTIRKENEVVFRSVEDAIATGERHTFSFPMEIETDDDAPFDIEVSITDEESPLTPMLVFPVENSSGYSAVAGAALFINPKTRTNSQANRMNIINETNATLIDTVWNNMNWGNDGWQTDEGGIRVLRLLAGSTCSIDYKPFYNEAAGTGKTIEFDFKAFNVVDGSVPIINISAAHPTIAANYIGLRIAPSEMFMHSQNRVDDTTQNLPIDDEVRLRVALTIMPQAYGNADLNLCCLYINGIKNRVFNYDARDYFAHNGNIVIGSDYADIDIYGIRVYDSALTSEGIHKNYINQLATTTEKEAEAAANDVLDGAGQHIDFFNTVDQYDCFVFDTPFPSFVDTAARTGTLEVWKNGALAFTVTDVACDGQGTSSKKYWEWNVRFRIDKKPNSVTTYADGRTDNQQIDMYPGITPKMQRITAKKNWASSMQDHKNGSVNAYNDLSKALGLSNPAMENDPLVRTAVYQQPMMGFSKQINEDGETIYTCMGQFTIGPDKGDTATFGYNKKVYPNLLAIEGSDNAPLFTLFRIPWNEPYVIYDAENENFQYNNTKSWELSAGNDTSGALWRSAYNFVYTSGIRLKPFNGTLEELNTAGADFNERRSGGYEYWIAKTGDAKQYNLYYYEATVGQFIPSDIGSGGINLYTQLVDKGYGLTAADLAGKSIEEINMLFIQARIRRFKLEAGNYFDIDDAIFHANFIEFIAGTDNRAKNTYAYNFGTEGAKWKWRQDDLDTILPIDNQGQDKKGYWVEVHDLYDNGGNVWNGETSNFWNLIELAFPNETILGMRAMLSAMESLSGMSSGTPYERVYGFYKKYYLGVKSWFPATIFNADAKRYEDAKVAQQQGLYNPDVDPMTQSHGDFFSAETAWMKKRILYMMSKYNYGTFSANGTDIIVVRAAGDEIVYTLTPAIAMYPSIASGTSIIRGERTMPGESCQVVIDLGGSGDQQNAILGASWLKSIGQWHDKNVSGTMSVQGRRLQEITLGHPTEEITISITGLTIANCPSVRLIDLRRIATLTGTLNITSCIHLEELYLDGTCLTQVNLPQGGGLRKINYPATNAYLMLKNFPVLTSENVDISLCAGVITDFFVQDCARINPIDMLVAIMDAQDAQGSSHALKRVRAVGFDATYTDTGSYILDRLAQLAGGEYVGLNADGIAEQGILPVLDGKLTVNADVYEDSLNAIREAFPKLELVVNGEYYVRFKDSIIGAYYIANYGNGIGVMASQLATVKNIPSSLFKGQAITSFTEMKYMTACTSIHTQAFYGCSSLTEVVLPPNLKEIVYSAFEASGIENITIPASVIYIQQGAFEGCSSLKSVYFEESDIPLTLRWAIFSGCTSLTEIDLPDRIIAMVNYTFRGCTSLRRVHYPSSLHITSIPKYEFEGCLALECIPLTPYITSIGEAAFSKCTSLTDIDLTGVNELQKGCFSGCSSLVNVLIPHSIINIPIELFSNCSSLLTLELHEDVISIETYVAARCSSLRALISLATIPPSLGSNLLYNSNDAVIYVPDASVDLYKAATNWSAYASRILPLSQY